MGEYFGTPHRANGQPQLSDLPGFLSPNPGLESGAMIMQYAAASLVSENKTLAHPASVDSIPSSANQEDHVSMGTIASRHAAQIIANARRVLAVELICAMQAADFRGPEKLAPKTKKFTSMEELFVRQSNVTVCFTGTWKLLLHGFLTNLGMKF